MSETTNIESSEILNMLQQSERLGAFKALIWLRFQIQDDTTASDIALFLDENVVVFNEGIYNDFKKQNLLLTDLDKITEMRKKAEKAAGIK